MRRFSLLLALAAVVASCQDRGITVPAQEAQFAAAGARPVHQVTGGGSIVREDIAGSPREIYGFHASIDAAGNVTGEAEVHFPSDVVKMHIAVQCLAIERNQAWLSGPVTRTDDPDTPVGRVFVWQVQDNGEGQGAPPDRISNFFHRPADNYPPDVCQEKQPRLTFPWDNGGVRILTPGGPSLADLVGTWDATLFVYYRLPDLGDTLDVLAEGRGARWTVAPDGRYSMVWWTPGAILENVSGTVDVVNGQMIQTADEDPEVILVQDLRVTGSTISGGGDFAFGHDWSGDGEEDPSRIVSEWRRKRSGVLVNDLAGTWDATVFRYTSTADPNTTVDLVKDESLSITLFVGLDSRFYLVVEPGGWTSTTDELLIEGNQMLTRNDDASAFVFSLEGDTWSFTGLDQYDFDGNGTPDPATLEVVLARR
jgi:hypothetical protein